MNDIIFNEFYSKQVNDYVKEVIQSSFTQGRSKGWLDAIHAIAYLKQNNMEITHESIGEAIFTVIKAEENDNTPETSPVVSKQTPNLYVVKNKKDE